MPSSPPPSLPADPANLSDVAAKRGARLALFAFVALSSLFVLSSTWQLTRAALFENDPRSALRNPAIAANGACAGRLRMRTEAVEIGLTRASAALTETEAQDAFDRTVTYTWDDRGATSTVCNAEPRGTDALATVERLRRAAESVARRRAGDLEQVRAEVATVLPPGSAPYPPPQGASSSAVVE
jgi:hypothetical protein